MQQLDEASALVMASDVQVNTQTVGKTFEKAEAEESVAEDLPQSCNDQFEEEEEAEEK